jgi:hypothetical protein
MSEQTISDNLDTALQIIDTTLETSKQYEEEDLRRYYERDMKAVRVIILAMKRGIMLGKKLSKVCPNCQYFIDEKCPYRDREKTILSTCHAYKKRKGDLKSEH